MSGVAPRVLPSVLDRLLDDGSVDAQRGQSVRALGASVRADLEALLNARRPWRSLPDRHAALRASILGYGLPDFAAGAFNSPAQREMLRREILATIRRFEPRLSDVVVSLLDRSDSIDPLLHIRVSGVLHAELSEEPISFETTLDTTTTDLAMRPQGNV